MDHEVKLVVKTSTTVKVIYNNKKIKNGKSFTMEYRLTNTPQNCPLKDKLNCQEESVVGLPSKHHPYVELRDG